MRENKDTIVKRDTNMRLERVHAIQQISVALPILPTHNAFKTRRSYTEREL